MKTYYVHQKLTIHLIISMLLLGFTIAINRIQPFSFPSKVAEGETVQVFCAVNSEEIHFVWMKNGAELPKNDRVEIGMHKGYSVLKIKSVIGSDSATYTCLSVIHQESSNFSATLNVEGPPRWVIEPQNHKAKEGDHVSIESSAIGHPLPTITWKAVIGGTESNVNNANIRISTNGTLRIESIRYANAGTYVCYANNGVSEGLRKEIVLAVIVPARFDDKFSVITVKKGDSASLKCEAIGDQPLTVLWRKDGKELRKMNSGRYEIFETLNDNGMKSELVLREADRTDGQLYTCSTENTYGKDERTIKLLVMEVPATPLDLKVLEVWSRTISVTWSPAYTGNSPITTYVLQYWRDTAGSGRHRLEEKSVTSAQTSALIKDLHPGTNYAMAILAENTVGRGEASDPVTFSTGDEEPSGTPLDVNVDVKGATSLLVTWKAPPKSEWNGKLKGYYVGYKMMQDSSHPYSFITVDYAPGGMQEHMVTGLKKDTEYSIIVKAFNAAGSGQPSQEVIVQTLGGDLPPSPVLYVVAVSENSVKIQWRSPESKGSVAGHTVHFRRKGDRWQSVPVNSALDSSYTLTGLQGASLYQVYVTVTSDYGEGDPSDVVTVKTYGGHDQVVLMTGMKEIPFNIDMSLLIPVLASLSAVIVVIVAVCIWVLKAKSRRSLERAIQEDKRYIYAAATQRYVDIDKTRSLPAYADGTLMHFQTPYSTVPMADDIAELMKEDRIQEMKAFLPQNMQDRPLPIPGNMKKRDPHVYDSAQ